MVAIGAFTFDCFALTIFLRTASRLQLLVLCFSALCVCECFCSRVMCITAALKPVPSIPKKLAVITLDAGQMLSKQMRPEQQQQRVPAAVKSRKRRESGGLCSILLNLLFVCCLCAIVVVDVRVCDLSISVVLGTDRKTHASFSTCSYRVHLHICLCTRIIVCFSLVVVDCCGCSSGNRLLTNQHKMRALHTIVFRSVSSNTEGAEGAPSEPAAAEGAAQAEAAVGADGGGGVGAGSGRPSQHSSGTSPERSTRVRQWAGESSGEESEGEEGGIGSDQLALATLERLNAHARRIATSVLDQYGAGNDLQSDIKA